MCPCCTADEMAVVITGVRTGVAAVVGCIGTQGNSGANDVCNGDRVLLEILDLVSCGRRRAVVNWPHKPDGPGWSSRSLSLAGVLLPLKACDLVSSGRVANAVEADD